MSSGLFATLHGITLFILALTLVYTDVQTSSVAPSYTQLAGFGLLMLAYIIAAELFLVGLSRFAGQGLGKTLRATWGLLILPAAVAIIADFKLFRAFGSHFDAEIIEYSLASLSDLLPIVAAEFDPITIGAIIALFLASAILTVIGWKVQHVRSRLIALAAVTPVAFLGVTIHAAENCPPSTAEEATPALYTLSSLTALTSKASQNSPCPPGSVPQSNGTVISRLKLAQLEGQPNNEEFFQNLETTSSTPLKFGTTDQSKLDNVVIIGLESFRADAVTPYAPALDTTPFLDRLAKEGIKAETGYVDFFHTSKSLIAMNCGMPPHPRYTVVENKENALPYPCLPDLLRPFGYTSAFFQTATERYERRDQLVANMKYDHFSSLETTDSTGWEKVNYFGIEDRAMIKPMMEWVDQQPGPFLLSIMTLTSHHSYHTPSTFEHKKYEGTGPWNNYLNTVRYTDAFLQDVFAEFEKRGLLDNTLFVLTGDHGVGVGYRNTDHPYRENIQIPLIVWSKQRIPSPVVATGPRQHSDIVPTVADLLDLEVTEGSLYGRSLLADADDRIIYIACKLNNCQVAIDGTFKLINYLKGDRTPGLFDLKEDPDDENDLLQLAAPTAIENYRQQLTAWREKVIALYEHPRY